MKKTSSPKLKWQLIAILGVFVIINIIFIWLFGFVFLDDLYLNARRTALTSATNQISESINAQNLFEIASEVSYVEDVTIIIVYNDGSVHDHISLFGWQSGLRPFGRIELLELFNNARLNGGVYSGFFTRTVGYQQAPSRTQVYVRIVETQNGELLGIISGITVPNFGQAVQFTVPIMLVFSGVVLLFASIAFFVGIKVVVKPIEALTASAKELAEGKVDVEFLSNKIRFKEVDELGKTLDYASKEISKTENLRKELIANISHDLRTPLTLIISYAELIKDFPENVLPDDVQVVIDEAIRLKNLVDSMLDLSKLQEVDRLNFKLFNLVDVLREIVNRHSKLLKHLGYKIELTCEESALVFADSMAIEQVIYNLLSNAVNYAGDDKLIFVKLIKKGQNARVEITDNGSGIDVEKLPHIFDRFYKSTENHRRAHMGTGLGLSIVKTIISNHPGGLYGVSSQKGKGSTFYFELPIEASK